MGGGGRAPSRWCSRACELALRLVFADAPGLGPALAHLVATALAYPVVVAGLVWGLRLRAPRGRAAPATGWGASHDAAGRSKAPAPRITRRALMLLGLQAGVVGAARLAHARPADQADRALPAARRGEPDQHPADPAGARHDLRPRRPAAGRQPAELPHRDGARAGGRPRGGAGAARQHHRPAAGQARAGAEGDGAPQRLRAGGGRRAPDLGRRGAGRRQRAGAAGGDPRGRPQPLLSRRRRHRARGRLRRPGLRERPRQDREPRPGAADPALPDRQDRGRAPASRTRCAARPATCRSRSAPPAG